MTDFNMDVSSALREMLREAKVRHMDVAHAAGRKSQGYVSQRLRGKHALSLDIVEAAAGFLDTTPHALMAELLRRTRR